MSGELAAALQVVTSYTEVWIEILVQYRYALGEDVTSYTEVWIEISWSSPSYVSPYCHFLHGSVD